MDHHERSVEFCNICGKSTPHEHKKLPSDEEMVECSMCGKMKPYVHDV